MFRVLQALLIYLTFNVVANDLPVARYCADLHREYLEMIGQGGSHANEFQPETLTDQKVKKEQ
jgi:hypothetical protein